MTTGKKEKQNILKYITHRWSLILFAGIIAYFLIGIILRGTLKNYLLDNHSKTMNAVIIDEENYWGNSPVSHTFSYSYEFIVEGKKYLEDSRKEKLKIGDIVLVEYLDFFPDFSRLKENK